jgi:dienelactone hydrolase
MLFFGFFLVFSVGIATAWEDIIAPPLPAAVGPDVLLIYIQGADIPTSSYSAITSQIQKQVSSAKLWVALPQMLENVAAIPTGISQGITRVSKLLAAAGMPANTTTFYGGHSLGGAMISDFVHDNLASTAAGVILHGSFLTRKYRTGSTSQGRPQYVYPVPVLTVGGELDGLCRITRIAESLYTQITFDANPTTATRKQPVTVIPGMCHGQFANSQALPKFVTNNDLQPEITPSAAVQQAAQDSAYFINAVLGVTTFDALSARVKASTALVQPIVTALQMEGYWNLLAPCLCETPDEYGGLQYGTCVSQPNCTGGSPWTSQFSQNIMGGGLGVTIRNTDSFHYVTEEKPSCHLPHIHGNKTDNTANPGNGKSPPLCSSPSGCTLTTTTVTEAHYKNTEFPDTGFYPTAAFELRTKLKSRQAVFNAAGKLDANITETDTPIKAGGIVDICAEINQASLEWASKTASTSAQSRYNTRGKKLSMGPDQTTCAAGPCWINSDLKYANAKDGTVSVSSTVMVTENHNLFPCGEPLNGQFSIPCTAGFHYCKILSPARALEWIYVDSLKPKPLSFLP